jgi:hypothetical protein
VALLSFDGSPHGGSQRHLPEWQSQPRITPTTIIDHSIVGSAEGAWLMFRDRSVLEAHFIVRKDGLIWQLMDTGRQADANLHANDFAVSIETEDDGDPDTQPWTRAQLESLAWLHNKLVAVHPSIPRRLCPSEAGGGLGYHTLFGAPSAWTPVAKSCPGAVRKRQWRELLLPAFIAGENLEEDDLPYTEAQLTEIAYQGALDGHRRAAGGSRDAVVSAWYERLEAKVDALEAKVDALAQIELTPQQIVDLGKAVALSLEIAGHPTLTITGTAVPAPSG